MVHVRPARPHELDDVAHLTVRAYEAYRQHMPDELWEEYEVELSSVHERAEQGTVLVAEADGGLCGAVSIVGSRDDPGKLYFRYLAVEPDTRRRGVGRTLIDAVIAHARGQGAHTLEWRTASFMDTALALYRSLGFEAEDSREAATGIRIWIYRLWLE
jgi:ribosomal protein S18 acetylase RimI-like enzyme